MKTIKKNVYYCEFCKKKGLSAYAIKEHELHCTNNPNRTCGFCENKMYYAEIAEKLRSRYEIIINKPDDPIMNEYESIRWIGDPVTMDEIFDLTDYCPACTLTLLKLAKMTGYMFQSILPFDFKEEKKKFWKEKNEDQERYDYYHPY